MAIKPISLLAGLPPEKLRWRCDPATIPFETTAEAELVTDLVGQERAFRALKMGVELSAPGYNIFVCGLAGTSRGGTITHVIEQIHPAGEILAGSLLRQQFQESGPPAPAHAAAGTGQ